MKFCKILILCSAIGLAACGGSTEDEPATNTETVTTNASTANAESEVLECDDGEWLSSAECMRCDTSAPELTCDTLDWALDSSRTYWDAETKTLTMGLVPGSAEIASFRMELIVQEDTASTQNGLDKTIAAVRVDGDVAEFNLTGVIEDGERGRLQTLRLEDTCGTVLGPVEIFGVLRGTESTDASGFLCDIDPMMTGGNSSSGEGSTGSGSTGTGG
jgi:hypothetical protein